MRQSHISIMTTSTQAKRQKRDRIKTISQPEHIILKYNEILIEYLEEKLNLRVDPNTLSATEKEEYNSNLEILDQLFPRNSDRRKRRKTIAYAALPSYMEAAGIDLEGLFNIFGTSMYPYPSYIDSIIHFCQKLRPIEIEKFCNILTPLIPHHYFEPEMQVGRPSYRVFSTCRYFQNTLGTPIDLTDMPEVEKSLNDFWLGTRIPIVYLPEIARRTGLSLHWLMKDVPCVYTNDPLIERAIDYFCFLHNDIKQAVLAMCEAAEGGSN